MMKKLSPFLLILCLLFACKKDETEGATTSLNGKWSTGGYHFEWYNASGMVVSRGVADAIKTYWTFEKFQMTLSYDFRSDVITSSYKVVNKGIEKHLFIDNASIAVQTDWKIESQTDQQMKISTKITDLDLITLLPFRTAVSGVKTIYLVREK
jgi:hypothetical protein